MKRYLKYIFIALTATIVAASCIEEMQLEQPVTQSDELTLVPRVKSFANQYVTKAGYSSAETKISRLAVLVFNSDGNLVHLQEAENATSVMLNKSMLNTPTQASKLASSTLVMIANVELDDITKADGSSIRDNKTNLTLAEMENYTCHFPEGKTVITSLGEGFTGFPMIGGLKNVNLTSTTSQQAAIEVGMKILYAKINFSISVAEGTENQSTGQGSGIQFNLTGYSVHNTSTATTLAIPASKGTLPTDFLGNTIEGAEASTTDVATSSAAYEYPATAGAAGGTTGTAKLGGSPVKFTFYVSESRYNHNSNLKGIYPNDDWLISATDAYDEDVKGYSAMSAADKAKNQLNGVKYFYDDIIQQYKPKLAQVTTGTPGAGLATYVLLNGTYTDYRGATWTVNYKVYLGKDNALNFHVDRNSEYTNNITFKGIRNNDSHNGEGQVWIDHRVNVTDASGAANHVTITRETLIDSHIEVRPLRVNWPEGEYVGVRVYLPTNSDGTLVNWIGIERFTGENNRDGTVYCYHGNQSTGKRKYFTTTLVSELQTKEGEFGVRDDNGRKYIYLLNGECAWIYFDENTTTSQRQADIDLEFYPESGSTTTAKYIVKQRGLQSIGGYKIESFEEYLHSYDSEDKYHLSTSPADYTQQGLEWGWDKQTISEDIIVAAAPLEISGYGIQDYVSDRYDFFHRSDIPSGNSYYPYTKDANGNWVTAAYGTGLSFTNKASEKKGITIKDMGTVPDNAYQYCLSKNKFREDAAGNHTLDIHWYLPDVYELQAVLNASQGGEDFGDDSYYWSSQPANDPSFNFDIPDWLTSIIGNIDITLQNEDPEFARAVSKSGMTDLERDKQHRIRCFYDATGITADMSDRIPDGIGGNFSFYMKAYNNNDAGYFNYMLPNATTAPDPNNGSKQTTNYGTENLKYPTFADPGSDFEYFNNAVDQNGNTVKGFGKNPALQSNWSVYSVLGQTFYYTLYNFTGLSEYTMDNATLANASRPTTTKKAKVNVESTKTRKTLQSTLVSASLNPLDHLTNGNMLKISFSNDKNASHSPVFTFSELVNGSKEVTTTYNWQVPTYPQDTYTPKADVKTPKYTATAQGSDFASNEANGKQNAESNGRAAALAAVKEKAEQEYGKLGYICEPIDPDNPNNYTYANGKWNKYIRRYTVDVTCTVQFKCTLNAAPIPYYNNATGGGWVKVTSVTNTVDGIETDELRMYCGNSFTISLADAYKNDYEITKVKVYYSGNNLVDEYGTLNADKAYARFVDSKIPLPTETLTVSAIGSTETMQLAGMDYSDDSDSGTGTHQWTGAGRDAVTLFLADYLVSTNMDGFSVVNVYQYTNTPRQPGESIIIDRIEVKCTPKSTSN